MDFWERMSTAFDRGLDKSKDLLGKARDRAQDMGERGVLRYEIMQLEDQAEKLVAKLGAVTYELLVTEGNDSISRESEGIQELIQEIDGVQTRIREKESSLELAKRKQNDADSLDNG